MTKILVVDDSAVDRRLVEGLVSKTFANTMLGEVTQPVILTASNGQEGLQIIQRENPDLVLTDLQMPEMDGLELVRAVKSQFPCVPVILMTAYGSEEIATQALHVGAASYVSKRNLARDLADTLETVLEAAGARKHQQRLLDECWVQTETYYMLPNDISHIAPLIGQLQENLRRMRLCDENSLIRVAVALREALSNGMVHGNLEVTSDLRDHDEKAYYALIQQRQQDESYEDRRVHVHARESRHEARYVIRDEGQGFDLNKIPDPTDLTNLEKVSGRGLYLIRTFMDEVHHNASGNEITLVKLPDRPA
jgi:CheY-like chemotaxis protein/anti-sigma regulatory factor (Ser/Thr protein kinase)